MSPRNWQLRITDMLDAIAAIQAYTVGMVYENFTHDRKTVDAVIRNLIIIGEAVNHVPEEVTQRYPEIPWADIQFNLPPLIESRNKVISDKP